MSATSSDLVDSETAIVVRNETRFVSREDEKSKPRSDLNKEYEQKAESTEAGSGIVDVRISTCDAVNGGPDDAEVVCRICHLGSEWVSTTSSTIQLGCSCKDELGISHRECAEAWFRSKGNRLCEICGETAKNVTGIEESGVLVGSNGMRLISTARNSSWQRRHRCSEFLLGCLILAFLLLWFFTRG